jgi:hypothetical protein
MKTQIIARALILFSTAFGSLMTVTDQSQEKVTWMRIDLYNDGNAPFTKGDATPALARLSLSVSFINNNWNQQKAEKTKRSETT